MNQYQVFEEFCTKKINRAKTCNYSTQENNENHEGHESQNIKKTAIIENSESGNISGNLEKRYYDNFQEEKSSKEEILHINDKTIVNERIREDNSGENSVLKSKKKLWTINEDKTIIKLVKKYGTKKWNLISNKLKEIDKTSERSGKQCRER